MEVDHPLLIAIFVMIVIQLATMVMLQIVYSDKNVRKMSQLLEHQNERIAREMHVAIERGTQAAHSAYEEANSVNVKIEDLNKRLLENK